MITQVTYLLTIKQQTNKHTLLGKNTIIPTLLEIGIDKFLWKCPPEYVTKWEGKLFWMNKKAITFGNAYVHNYTC